jgi:hypothetical protein
VKRLHELKIQPEFYNAVVRGYKNFEIRNNDRGFCVGDHVILYEFEHEEYTGRVYSAIISYITDYEQKPGFVVFGMIPKGHD